VDEEREAVGAAVAAGAEAVGRDAWVVRKLADLAVIAFAPNVETRSSTHKIEHTVAKPCYEVKCPECGTLMTRE